MDIFPVDWQAHDTEEDSFEIHCWGRCAAAGSSVLVRIRFFPYFFVRLPESEFESSEAQHRYALSTWCQKHNAVPSMSCIVHRVPLLGFTGCSKRPFAQLAFDTLRDFKKARYGLKNTNKTYEASLDPLLRFFHVRGIDPSAWVHVERGTEIVNENKVSIDGVREFVCDFRDVSKAAAIDLTPRLVLASWDLECVSESGMFPDASKPLDKIICIGTAFQRYGETEPYHRCVVTLGTCDPIEGVEVVPCCTEHEMINVWLAYMRDHEVDVLIGYNTTGFDYPYLNGRACVLTDDRGELLVDLGQFGKSAAGGGLPIDKKLSSGAYGDNTYHYLSSPGAMPLDLLQIFRKDLKLESYSLNAVCRRYLDNNMEKIDLKPGEIFAKFTQGSKERCEIATYCVRDVELPLKLCDKLATLTNTLAMSNATCVPVDYLMNRGQQIRVYSLLVRKARALGFVAPDIEKKNGEVEVKYQGATVLEAKTGAHFDIISGLDFASLYPSIMRAHCMCPSTIVLSPRYAAVEGVEYYEIDGVRFAQDVPCVVPALLEELAGFRKAAKKRMAAAPKGSFEATVFNGLQSAYKVSMNSVYGFFGATRGIFPLVELAAAVTSTGREMIARTKHLAETLVPGSDVVYGDTDSVMVRLEVGEAGRHDMHEHFRVAQQLARDISATFKAPIELEFEKCYFPYLLFSKKRYAGLMYTTPEKPDAIDVKGLQLVRRDNAPIVREVSAGILDDIMYSRSRDRAVEVARASILRVLRGEVPLDSFVISKSAKHPSSYKNPESLPHVCVAEKIKARRGYAVASGERVRFVFVRDPRNADALMSARAEDPDYVAEHGLELDALYYVRNQMLSPIATLLEVMGVDVAAEILGHPDIAPRLAELEAAQVAEVRTAKRVRTNAANKQREITAFLNR